MSSSRRPPYRPVNGIDIAASAAAWIAPRSLRRSIDQARRDARSLLDAFTGTVEPTFRSRALPTRVPQPLDEIDPLALFVPRALTPRYEALKRDVRVVTRGLAGEHPPPLVERKRAPIVPESGARTMRVVSVQRETANAIVVELACDRTGATTFEPGQFLSLRCEVNGETLWRAYSLCTAPHEGKLSVAIKRVAGGRASNHLNDTLAVGQRLEVRGPSGRFTLPASSSPRHLVLIAGGSGITPLLSHGKHWLRHEPHARITLLYGNRCHEDVMFAAELATLARQHAQLTVQHVLEEAHPSATRTGRFDADTTHALLDALGPDGAETHYLVCGPEPMMQAVSAVLSARNVDSARIREERFANPHTNAVARPSLSVQDVTLELAGTKRTLRVLPDQTILDAALAAQVTLPFSCTMGGCGACMMTLRAGEVHMDTPHCLSERERAEGKVLTCIAHPLSTVQLGSLG